MLGNCVRQTERFVDFLNEEFDDGLKVTSGSCFELRNYRFNFSLGDRKQIVLNNMHSPTNTSFYGRNIKRVAKVSYSKGKIVHFSPTGRRVENEDRLWIKIVDNIKLGLEKNIEPQEFILHQYFSKEEDATYIEQIKGSKQLAYKNGIWQFAI